MPEEPTDGEHLGQEGAEEKPPFSEAALKAACERFKDFGRGLLEASKPGPIDPEVCEKLSEEAWSLRAYVVGWYLLRIVTMLSISSAAIAILGSGVAELLATLI